MPLAMEYVYKVLDSHSSVVLFDEANWASVIKALKFEDRDLENCVLGRMKLRMTPGGFDGLQAELDLVTKERDMLLARVAELSATTTAPVSEEGISLDATNRDPSGDA